MHVTEIGFEFTGMNICLSVMLVSLVL